MRGNVTTVDDESKFPSLTRSSARGYLDRLVSVARHVSAMLQPEKGFHVSHPGLLLVD